MTYNFWSNEEINNLKRMWSSRAYSRQDIFEAIPNRSWYSIQHKARDLNLKERPVEVRRKYNPTRGHPLCKELRNIRMSKDLTRKDVEKLSGYSEFSITDWENGDRLPRLRGLIDWANSLGYELKLVIKR